MGEVIVVTGATGTVGREVVRALAGGGAAVRAGVHTPSRAEGLRGTGVELVELAYERPQTLDAAMRGATSVVVLLPFAEALADMGTAVVEAARRAGVRRGVLLSRLGADAESPTALGRLYRRVEVHAMESSIAFRIVRTAPLMQSLVHFFGDTLRRERALFLPLGEGRVRWVHGRDVAALIASAAARGEGPAGRNGVGRGAAHGNTGPGVLQAIAGPEALRLDEVVEILGHALGTPLRFVDVPEEAAERALTEGGLSPWAVRSLVEIHGECREGLFCADTPEVDAALGRPRLRFVRYAEEVAPLLR